MHRDDIKTKVIELIDQLAESELKQLEDILKKVFAVDYIKKDKNEV